MECFLEISKNYQLIGLGNYLTSIQAIFVAFRRSLDNLLIGGIFIRISLVFFVSSTPAKPVRGISLRRKGFNPARDFSRV